MAFNQVNALEFNEIKAQIKDFLRSQSQFSDYDFEGSSLTVLLDILAYNTYYTAVNANLAVNEGFLETAVLRENVVKLARQLGYTPKSARSATTDSRYFGSNSISLSYKRHNGSRIGSKLYRIRQ